MLTLDFYLFFYLFYISLFVILFALVFIYFLFFEFRLRFIFLYNYYNPFYFSIGFFSYSFFYDLFNFLIPSFMVVLLVKPSFSMVYLFSSLKEVFFSYKVISSQWFWSFNFGFLNSTLLDSYLLDFSPFSLYLLGCSDSIVFILGLPFRVFLTSTDVIHSFSVFGLGVKLDCIPGRVNFFTSCFIQSGLFYGLCSELCGLGHSFMSLQLEVVNSIF